MGYKGLLITSRNLGYIFIICILIITLFDSIALSKGRQSLLNATKHQDQGRYPEAISEYYKLIEKDPHNLEAYFNLAMIIEIVLEDNKNAIMLYDKALSIASNKKAFFFPGQECVDIEFVNTTISKMKERKRGLIQNIFSSIDGIVFPRYIVLIPGKHILSKPVVGSQELGKDTTKARNEFRFVSIINNWYQVMVPLEETGWIKGDDIRLIYQNSNESIRLSISEKAARYKMFTSNFPEHELATKAKERLRELSRELSKTKIIKKKQEGAPHKSDKNDIQSQLDKIEERYRNGLINDKERKSLRMAILRQL